MKYFASELILTLCLLPFGRGGHRVSAFGVLAAHYLVGHLHPPLLILRVTPDAVGNTGGGGRSGGEVRVRSLVDLGELGSSRTIGLLENEEFLLIRQI